MRGQVAMVFGAAGSIGSELCRQVAAAGAHTLILLGHGENSLFERLGRWCQGGALGWVFDQADDRLLDLHAANVIGFDTTEFLDLPEVRTPVMMYLLQVMEELVNGERLIYVISEFWKALDHPIFSEFAKQKQKTIRKQNGLGIFDTQSPSDVLRHPIGRTMIEQSVTKIFLANPEAVREEYVEDDVRLNRILINLGTEGCMPETGTRRHSRRLPGCE